MMGIVAVAAFAAAAAEAPTAAITATGRRARVPAHRLILDVHHLVVGVEQSSMRWPSGTRHLSFRTGSFRTCNLSGDNSMADHHILFVGEIDGNTANKFTAALLNQILQQPTNVIIGINSGGGNVVSGIAMYNTMLAMPYPIVTHNIGSVDSIATVVFLGGAQRYSCAASTFMFHGVGFTANAGQRLEENNLKAFLDTVLADHKQFLASSLPVRTDTPPSIPTNPATSRHIFTAVGNSKPR
jgi:hypothetical protein